MLGERKAEQFEFFAGSLRDLIPDEHVLARVARVLDLAWLRDEVASLYCSHNGRPGIEPETAVRLMLAGFLLGLVHDRRLMREAAVNVAIRWFCGFGLTERLPDHSSLTRIRQRWGEARFRRIFERTVAACVGAGIAKGEGRGRSHRRLACPCRRQLGGARDTLGRQGGSGECAPR